MSLVAAWLACALTWALIPHRSLHCPDNQLTDNGKVVSPIHRLCSTPQKHYSSASGTHCC
jgi:hypothetical protein